MTRRGWAVDYDGPPMAERKSTEEKDLQTAAGGVTADALASSGLLSSYDRLRQRVTGAIEKRSWGGGRVVAEVLLLAPDLFVLLLRLALDSRVPADSRRFILGALVYFVTPVDLLPEALLGAGGYLDDVVLVVAVLSVALGSDLDPLAESHWSGSRRLRLVLRDVSHGADQLLGESLFRRLQRLLARWGIKLQSG